MTAVVDLAAFYEGYACGCRDGWDMGRKDEAAERDEAWNRIAGPVSRSGNFAEAERVRWTVRGEQRTREDFGQPHIDDYKGREAAT